MTNLKLLFTKSSSLNATNKKKKKLMSRWIGISLIIIQLIISVVFLIDLLHLNVVPDKYLLMVIALLVVFTAIFLALQFTKVNILGKVLSVLLSIVLVFGCIYVTKTTSTLDDISSSVVKNVSEISILVMNEDTAQNLADVKNYNFGINSAIDKENTDIAISKINDKLGSSIKTTEYIEWESLINGLYSSKVKAIIFNEAYRTAMEDLFPDFDTKTKKIDETVTIENQNDAEKDSNVQQFISDGAFSVYIAGNDQYGTISLAGRNDVNIIATINPETKQILLLTTPRDYYITLFSPSGNKGLDKLTHAGNYGIQGSETALERLYGRKLDYYMKLNFSGMIGIVDSLNGITVDSDFGFVSLHGGYTFKKGPNYCNGDQALAFCRERYAFANGDFQRGRDQLLVIKSIIAKATTPTILTNYTQVLNSVLGFVETNMPTDTMTGLIKETLNGGNTWNIQTYDVTGTGSTEYCQLFGGQRSVVLPDYKTVNIAKELMNKIGAGEVFDVKSYVGSK